MVQATRRQGQAKLSHRKPMAVQAPIWEPQPGPQTALLACDIYEVFFGGARGGGKTDGMLGDFAAHAIAHGGHASGVFFRRTARQLEEVIHRAQAIYPRLGGHWVKSTLTWDFKRGPAAGARLKMRHLWDEADAENYMGHAYTWVCFEEMTNWPTPAALDRIRATLRSAHGVKVKFRGTGNPGGPGHNWVKARYVDPAPAGYQPIADARSGEFRVFIPARLDDNPALQASDPGYAGRLRAVGAAPLVRAWLHGDWSIVAGGFFDDVWRPDRHVLAPFAVPPTWRRARSFDWGSAAPASLGLWAESDGTVLANGLWFPRGSLLRVDEWYTAARDGAGQTRPDEGLRLTNEQLGEGIARRSEGERWRGCVADPSIFAERGGPQPLRADAGGCPAHRPGAGLRRRRQ